MAIVEKGVIIDAPIEKVYEYCSNPETWPEWYTNITGVIEITGNGGIGTVAEMEYTILAVSFPITFKVIEDNLHFRRLKISGLIKGEQDIDLVAAGNRTEVDIYIEYNIPSVIQKEIPNMTAVEQLLENSLANTLENLKTICEAMNK